jgi:hemoglobin
VSPSLYEAAGEAEGLLRLAAAWHERVLADEVVAHAFSHGYHPDHTARLAAYWAEALGGPSTYTVTIADESTVVRMHSGDGPHDEMNDRAVRCFDEALVEVGLASDPRLRRALHDWFAWATTVQMNSYNDSAAAVPDGLPVRHWDWDGLVDPS